MIDVQTQRGIELFGQIVARAVGEMVREFCQKIGKRVDFVVVLSCDADRPGPDAPGFMTYLASHKDRGGTVQMLRELAAKIDADPATAELMARHRKKWGDAPVRFQVEQFRPDLGHSFNLQEVPDSRFLRFGVDGRLAGVLVLTQTEELALLERLFTETPREMPQ